MQRIAFNFDWTRSEGGRRFFGAMGGGGDAVCLPDDYIIGKSRDPRAESGPSTGFYPGGRATYSKTFDADTDWADKTVLLNVDGAYMNAEVTLNGDLLALHPYGYTPFTVDLTGTLKAEGNSLSISTDSVQPSSRWYSGGGLYRELSLLIGGACYLHPWDVFLYTTEAGSKSAVVEAKIEITNPGEKVKKLTVRVKFDGSVVGECSVNAKPGKTAAAMTLTIDNPKLWSADVPALYDVAVELVSCKKVIDSHEMRFGVRRIEIDSRNGMRVNGLPVKLRGGCVHHDNSLIGARAVPRAEERKVQKLKEAGYNAIRCAHNPPSAAFLDACDRIGMYVLDESFDAWRVAKNARDYHLYFEQWWQTDTAAMVCRDRNHPCVYSWSIGNEISEMNGSSNGAYWCRVQADFVRGLDPTRPVSSSMNHFVYPQGMNRATMMHTTDMSESLRNPQASNGYFGDFDYWDEGTKDTTPALDIVGYNYIWPRYAIDAKKHPDRVIHATETHAFMMYDYWQAVLDNDNCIGDFTWTATDNLGEGGAGRVIWDLDGGFAGLIGSWPWLSCYQGDLDLDLKRRPQSYYRGIVWGLDKNIYLYTTHPDKTGKPFYGMGWHWADVWPTWSFGADNVGKDVQLEAYCDCDEVEFVCNGRSMGRVKTEKYKAFLTVPYAPGVVEAVAYTGGEEVARTKLETAGTAAQVILEPDRCEIAADGMDLSYITVRVADAEGRTVVCDNVKLSVSVTGGELLGFGSANPCTEENYTTERNVFGGYALACVRAGREPGEIRVTVTGEGLSAGSVCVKVG